MVLVLAAVAAVAFVAGPGRAGASPLRVGLPGAMPLALLQVPRPPSDPDATPEDIGAHGGARDGRRAGLEAGQDLGRAQALSMAWQRGFRKGLSTPASWHRDSSWDQGESEGRHPGRAAGLPLGQERGRDAAAAAFLELRGRPSYLSEPAPPASSPPAPPHPACAAPPDLLLHLTHGTSVRLDPQSAERDEAPLGWDVPRPDYPRDSELRGHARDDGFNDDALEAWMRGYKSAFRSHHEEAFRAHRDMTPGNLHRHWEADGEIEGRREGARRKACEDHAAGFAAGWRDGFAEGFGRGHAEGWEAEERRHLENPVIRILSARMADATDDGVVEPGEGLTLDLELANAGMRDAEGEILAFEGTRSLAARGAVTDSLRSQSRDRRRIDLGRADESALLGAGLALRLVPLAGTPQDVELVIGRPVRIARVSATPDVDGSRVLARVRAEIESVATRPADRDLGVVSGAGRRELGVVSGAGRHELGVIAAGEVRTIEMLVEVPPRALAEGMAGDVELRSGDARWMRSDWRHDPAFGDAVRVASRLPAGSAPLHEALDALSLRLRAELERAMDDPKLYARLDDGSDLSALSRVLPGLPAATRADVEQRLVHPLQAHGEAKGTPRKVRRAIRQALGRD